MAKRLKIDKDIVITQDLSVQGKTETIQQDTLSVKDNLVAVNSTGINLESTATGQAGYIIATGLESSFVTNTQSYWIDVQAVYNYICSLYKLSVVNGKIYLDGYDLSSSTTINLPGKYYNTSAAGAQPTTITAAFENSFGNTLIYLYSGSGPFCGIAYVDGDKIKVRPKHSYQTNSDVYDGDWSARPLYLLSTVSLSENELKYCKRFLISASTNKHFGESAGDYSKSTTSAYAAPLYDTNTDTLRIGKGTFDKDGSGNITNFIFFNGDSQAIATRADNMESNTYAVWDNTLKQLKSGNIKNGVGAKSILEGYAQAASGYGSHAEGNGSEATGQAAHAEGLSSIASGNYSHAEGTGTKACGENSHAEGFLATAFAQAAHAEGISTNEVPSSISTSSNSSDIRTAWNSTKFSLAFGQASHVEGKDCLALAVNTHAEGIGTTAAGTYSHAEGYYTTVSGDYAHAEGYQTLASNTGAHAEGYYATASGMYSHAEGYQTKARASCAHAEGYYATASGNYSHASGYYTTALTNQYAIGHYNDTTKSTAGTNSGTGTGTALVIGNGTSSTKSNAFRVDYNGKAWCKSTYSSTGADYAEYFEWLDQNPENEDRRGYFVTMDGEMIKKAEPGDYILGIVSGMPAVLGNTDVDWSGRHLRDEFGAFILEEFEYEEEEPVAVFNEETGETTIEINKVTKVGTRYKENPDYDPDRPYIQRDERPEWSAVGMIGVLSVRDDGSCQINGYCKVAKGGIATTTTSKDGYRVISRVNKNIIKIIFR